MAKLDRLVGVLNGLIGDHLARTRNELAIPMTLMHDGAPLALDATAVRAALPEPKRRVVVMVHGLMATESVWAFGDGSLGYGHALARDHAMTAVHVRYNSGRAIADNGAALATLLEALLDVYPVPIDELTLLGHSMGGLVIRSACHVAADSGQRWLARVVRAIYVGTPHRGAPLERVGRVVSQVLRDVDDPYTVLLAQLGDLRSDGIKDLGDADLRHQDRDRRAPRFALRDPRHPVPLLPSIQHYLVAGSVSLTPWITALFGDAIVPLASATDGIVAALRALPPDHVALLPGVNHNALAHHPDVYARIHRWCAAEEIP